MFCRLTSSGLRLSVSGLQADSASLCHLCCLSSAASQSAGLAAHVAADEDKDEKKGLETKGCSTIGKNERCSQNPSSCIMYDSKISSPASASSSNQTASPLFFFAAGKGRTILGTGAFCKEEETTVKRIGQSGAGTTSARYRSKHSPLPGNRGFLLYLRVCLFVRLLKPRLVAQKSSSRDNDLTKTRASEREHKLSLSSSAHEDDDAGGGSGAVN